MLELRPNCEFCNKNLPPASTEACICTYECTFCSSCVEHELKNVCPNCGSGFTPRPIRPKKEHRSGVSLKHFPASSCRTNTLLSSFEIKKFVTDLEKIPPKKR